MRSEEEIEKKLELKEELLEFVEKDNKNRPVITAWIEALKWTLAESKESEKEEKTSTKEEKSKKNLIDPDSVIGRMLAK